MMSEVLITNSCPIETWMSEEQKEFRDSVHSFVEKILIELPFVDQDKKTILTYLPGGVSGVVVKVETLKETFVVKTAHKSKSIRAEALSLQAWHNQGIRVPQILHTGTVDNRFYFVMPFFAEKTLAQIAKESTYDQKAINDKLAVTFAKLHTVPAKNYGEPVDYIDNIIIGEFSDLETYLGKTYQEKVLLENVHTHGPKCNWNELLEKHLLIVKNHIDTTPTLGSYDFRVGHFFATEPLTFFDPYPIISPPNFDLAYLCLPEPRLSEADFITRREKNRLIFRSSFKVEDFDQLVSAFWLQTFRKAGNILRKPEEARVKRAQHMLNIIKDQNNVEKHLNQFLS